MIFGFNTDVSAGDTTYHVQSEARERDLLLQTQVFVKGRCIGKCAVSYAKFMGELTDEELKESLKAQHRLMMDAVRGGNIENVLANSQDIQDLNGDGLAVKWTNPDTCIADQTCVMAMLVTDAGRPVAGARLITGLGKPEETRIQYETTTGDDGSARVEIPLLPNTNDEIAVFVHAQFGEKAATRKFRFRHR